MSLLKFLCLLSISITAGATSPRYIGGFQPDFIRPGTVRLGSGNVLGNCTGTFVSPTHILTASHCLATDPYKLLTYGTPPSSFPPPYNETVDVLLPGNVIQQEHITISNVFLFPRMIYGSNPSAVAGATVNDQSAHLLEVGDFAILQLDKPAPGVKSFAKILFAKAIPTERIWVGGFGRKGSGNENFATSCYSGTYAKFGKMINAFYSQSKLEFKKESTVSIELYNLPGEISFLGGGDSGGAVFVNRGNESYVTAVAHVGHYGNALGLKINPQNGLIQERPAGEFRNLVGFAHHFTATNLKLINWVKQILPATSYVIEN